LGSPVGPDADDEREHCYGGEAGILKQLAESEFEIIHNFVAADVRRLWTMPKSEGRNPKEARSSKSEQSACGSLLSASGFRISDFIRASEFGFRI